MKRYRPLIIGLALAVVLLAGFYELAEDFASSPSVLRFDTVVSEAVQSLRGPVLTVVMKAITVLGGTPAVGFATLLLFVALLWRGRLREANYAAAVVLGAGLLTATLKDLFGRARPPAENALIKLPASFSFPSGHALGSLALAWVLGHSLLTSPFIDRRWKRRLLVPIALYPVLVGTSRVYLGVHWPSDVLASWLLGGAWIALATGVHYTWFAEPGGQRGAERTSEPTR